MNLLQLVWCCHLLIACYLRNAGVSCTFGVHGVRHGASNRHVLDSGSRLHRSHSVKIGVILPYDVQYPWSTHLTIPAIQYAVDSIRLPIGRRGAESAAVDEPRPGVGLLASVASVDVAINDSRCSETFGPLAAFDMHLAGVAHVFVGPVCHYAVAPVARFSPHWNIPVITAGALVHAFDNRSDEFRLLTRMLGPYCKLSDSVAAILSAFGWTSSIGLIYRQHAEGSTRAAAGKSEFYFLAQAIHFRLTNKRQQQQQQQHGRQSHSSSSSISKLSPPSAATVARSASGSSRPSLLPQAPMKVWNTPVQENTTDYDELLQQMSLNARSTASYLYNHASVDRREYARDNRRPRRVSRC